MPEAPLGFQASVTLEAACACSKSPKSEIMEPKTTVHRSRRPGLGWRGGVIKRPAVASILSIIRPLNYKNVLVLLIGHGSRGQAINRRYSALCADLMLTSRLGRPCG